jgi:hypothetical protein
MNDMREFETEFDRYIGTRGRPLPIGDSGGYWYNAWARERAVTTLLSAVLAAAALTGLRRRTWTR